MNVEIANKLLNLRKTAGLSQEELAEKIGVSRQAVSKWERAESSPDTDNLIALSKIYKVSIDELLSIDKDDTIAEDKQQKKAFEKQETAFGAMGAMIAVIIFLITGIVFNLWYINWVIFLIVPIFHFIPSMGRRRNREE